MKLNRTGSLWDRNQRNGINENWQIIEGDYKNIVDNVSNKAYQQVVDNAKLNWKEPVNSYSNLPSSATKGDTRMTRDTGKVYRYSGTAWQEIQQIDAGPVNELDSRVSTQLAQKADKTYVDDEFEGFNTHLAQKADKTYVDDEFEGFNTHLAQSVKLLKNGELRLPSDFLALPFKISKERDGGYSHNATPYNQHNWATATEVFISRVSHTGDGTNYASPITLQQFKLRHTEGLYNTQTDFILTLVDNSYTDNYTLPEGLSTINANFLVRSKSVNGFTWVGILRKESDVSQWTPNADGTYKAVVSSSNALDYPVNFKSVDSDGIPSAYNQKETRGECANELGSYYIEPGTSDIYINPHPTEKISDIQIGRRFSITPFSNMNNNTIIFENIGFLADSYTFSGTSTYTKFYFFNCKFYRGSQDAFGINGVYHTFLFDCVSAYASKDAFNYHTSSSDSLAVEVNCKGFGSGTHKFIGGNTTTTSNNGSTAHDGMYMLRVGCDYWECEGPIVADIQNCYSISIGCSSYDILPTDGLSAGFYVQNETGTLVGDEKPKYFIECKQSGDLFLYGMYAINSTKTYYQNFQGHHLNVGITDNVSWEDIVNE